MTDIFDIIDPSTSAQEAADAIQAVHAEARLELLQSIESALQSAIKFNKPHLPGLELACEIIKQYRSSESTTSKGET
jgi:hypothetical protein